MCLYESLRSFGVGQSDGKYFHIEGLLFLCVSSGSGFGCPLFTEVTNKNLLERQTNTRQQHFARILLQFCLFE